MGAGTCAFGAGDSSFVPFLLPCRPPALETTGPKPAIEEWALEVVNCLCLEVLEPRDF